MPESKPKSSHKPRISTEFYFQPPPDKLSSENVSRVATGSIGERLLMRTASTRASVRDAIKSMKHSFKLSNSREKSLENGKGDGKPGLERGFRQSQTSSASPQPQSSTTSDDSTAKRSNSPVTTSSGYRTMSSGHLPAFDRTRFRTNYGGSSGCITEHQKSVDRKKGRESDDKKSLKCSDILYSSTRRRAQKTPNFPSSIPNLNENPKDYGVMSQSLYNGCIGELLIF